VAGATYTLKIDDNADCASPLRTHNPTTSPYTLPLPTLSNSTYYWCITVNTVQMPSWVLHISPTTPTAPVLAVPVANAILQDNTPLFQWNAVTEGQKYQIQIDNDATFASPVQDTTDDAGARAYTATTLANGRYYWRVRAINSYGALGAWSLSRQVTIDVELPNIPIMLSPANGANVTNRMLVMSWQAVPGTSSYEVRLDTTTAFTQPVISTGTALNYHPTAPLTRGTYHWQVRALDAAGNASEWSNQQTFIIVAGITVQGETPVPLPSFLQVIEAESSATSGIWTSYDSESASAERYVYSSGSTNDTLTINFTGTQVDVIYIQHPALGSFAIEIDGVVVQTVTSTSDETVFGTKTSVTSLPAGSHTLRIVPVSGTIAVDAFAVELQTVVVTPETTTVPPTAEVTPVVPIETAVPPTVAPQQILESDVDIAQRAGIWTLYPTDLASGGAYLYSSGSLSDTLSLTFSGTQIDVIYIQHPALGTFALEVDGSVAQIINAYATETVFGTHVTITLPAGQHTLRIIPVSGTVAIDAFALDVQATVIAPTIEPTIVPPTEIPPTVTPIPATLPFTANFDTSLGWTPVGLWTLDPVGFVGTGWFASSATRGQMNTLTFDTEIDLSMAFYPHLTFWQRGQLSSSDSLVLDISQDHGQSWAVVDLTTSVTTDWTLYDLDLSPFAGKVIRLRFRLDVTQLLPEGTTSVGYWLDDLGIQDVPPVSPTVEPTVEPPTAAPTEIPMEILLTEEVE
jgi:hypothetical protein